MKLLSIVTPCLNRAEFVGEALDSALVQDYAEVEHILQDGGSTDGTLAVLARHPHLKVVSEPDRNLFDALNKGIARASGEIIGHLNTDDLYEPNIFKRVMQIFEENPEADAIAGRADLFEDMPDGTRKTLVKYEAPRQDEAFECATMGLPVFNAWFFRKRALDRLGGFNIEYRIAADRNLLIHFFLNGGKWLSIDETFYHYRKHSGSLTFSATDERGIAAREEYFKISEGFMQDVKTRPELLAACRAWHRRDSIEYCVHALYLKQYARAGYYARRGLSHDPGWLPALWRRLSPTLWRRLGLKSGGMPDA